MFNEKELQLIYSGLIKILNNSKKDFEENKSLEIANKIDELNELIKKVEEML